jgi:deazaflavin-dependent oxidoreductase (nitroreductase family)
MQYRAIATLALCVLAVSQTGCMTAFAAFQPENIGGPTIVITTTGADGALYDRVLSPIDDDGQLVVSANHWPRAWYRRALANPDVRVTREGQVSDYRAVPVSAEERERLLDDSGFPLVAYLFTGFAPRQFLRLEPR